MSKEITDKKIITENPIRFVPKADSGAGISKEIINQAAVIDPKKEDSHAKAIAQRDNKEESDNTMYCLFCFPCYFMDLLGGDDNDEE